MTFTLNEHLQNILVQAVVAWPIGHNSLFTITSRRCAALSGSHASQLGVARLLLVASVRPAIAPTAAQCTRTQRSVLKLTFSSQR